MYFFTRLSRSVNTADEIDEIEELLNVNKKDLVIVVMECDSCFALSYRILSRPNWFLMQRFCIEWCFTNRNCDSMKLNGERQKKLMKDGKIDEKLEKSLNQ